VADLDWPRLTAELDREGSAVVPGLLDEDAVDELVALGLSPAAHALDALDLGRGELRWLDRMPTSLAELHAAFYERLAPIADAWNAALGLPARYPATLDEFRIAGERDGATRTLSSLVRLRAGDHLALHQRNVGARVFPLQLVALLSEPGHDYTGGEFVMTEQRPRMQSRPIVLPLRRGDMAVIAVGHRPHRGSKGHYRVNLKHAVSRVREGERLGLELPLHDGPAD